MSVADAFLLAVRWIHGLAAVAWIGGSLFYLVVLRPVLRRTREGAARTNALVSAEFRGLVDVSVVVLVLTGAILTFDRLTSRFATSPYVLVLALKVVLALWMFLLAGALRGRRRRSGAGGGAARQTPSRPPTRTSRVLRALSAGNLIVIIGILVFLLADLLRALFELALTKG